MNTNINILTLNNYFSQNNEENDEFSTFQTRKIIVPNSFFSINEANICYKIKKIPYYTNYFSILEDYELLNISQLNDNIAEKLNYNEKNQYYLFKYRDNNSIDFVDYIYKFISIKEFIFSVIHIFPHIFTGLSILNEKNICFFNISPKNIIFLQNYREKPVFSDFSLSLRLNKLDFTYISNILNKLDDFTYQPLEVHILFYFVKNDITTISYSFIEEFSEKFVENLNILRLFTDNYRNLYKEKCIETMRKYINLPKDQIIQDIIERNDKWDVYGISMLYTQIFGCIHRIFSLKNNFISKITLELSKNLHPDSDKRMSLDDTLLMFNKLLDYQEDWSFINYLNNSKLDDLFDELSK
jgi:hypothetical protein